MAKRKRNRDPVPRLGEQAYANLYPLMSSMRAGGATYRSIADQLNQLGHARRRAGPWIGGAVANVLRRYRSLEKNRELRA